MSRRTIGALAAVAALAALPALPALAGTSGHASHQVNLTLQQVPVQTTGTAGAPGYSETDAQIDNGTPGGRSAGITTITYGQAAAFTGKTTIYTATGVVRVDLHGTYSLGATGYTVTGTGKVIGGSGHFKGAAGKVSFTGGQMVNSTVRTVTVTGTMTY
ncbi:MAG: hypothetical protein ACYDAR_22440 [Thermomicrobiales bacterium]